MTLDPLEPCCDCGRMPIIQDNADGPFSRNVVKWFTCVCGRTSSARGCGTRSEATKKWNKTMRFVLSTRKRSEEAGGHQV